MTARNAESAALRAPLTKSFANVPLGLKLLGGPIRPGSPSIFQMSICQSPRFGEYFQVWPGAADNQIEVLSADQCFVQLVLRVKEPRRRFIETVQKSSWRRTADVETRARLAGGRILKETRYDWRLEMWTPEEDRRFLCGKDDLHLFIARVPSGDTVAEAHESLKPQLVREAEARDLGRILRQGEWFFLPIAIEERERLEARMKESSRAVKLHSAVGPGGRPHVAERVVSVDRRIPTRRGERRVTEVYARGLVRHPDHRNEVLDEWRRVVRNNEIQAAIDDPRQRWID